MAREAVIHGCVNGRQGQEQFDSFPSLRVASLMNILLRLQASSPIESSSSIVLRQLGFPHSTFFFTAFKQGGKHAD